jgi:hypothetical protein
VFASRVAKTALSRDGVSFPPRAMASALSITAPSWVLRVPDSLRYARSARLIDASRASCAGWSIAPLESKLSSA